ncbi:MAG: DNA translocase FtsK 4TM domain-containing protein, partial [Nitrosomonas sp.]|nr:DNA translocase FtsK 4TM domain-containing protein [Nitrosomonas sp.]
MSLINKPMAKKSSGHSFSPRVARLLRESGLLMLMGAALYLVLIFFSYDRGDAGWSHSGDFNQIQNAGGHAGAWLADLLLYLFGASAWWWVAFFLSA